MSRKSFIILFLFLYSNFSFAKIFPPEVLLTKDERSKIEELEKIKIPEDGFRIFYYDQDFAIMANDLPNFPELDLKKSVKLPPLIHGIGITVKQTRPENKYQLEEYRCSIHLFVDHKDDYWLPKDRTGTLLAIDQVYEDVDFIAQAHAHSHFDATHDYNMRSFYGNTKTDHLKNNPQVLGSLDLKSYIKNVYDNIDYIQYSTFCHQIAEDKDRLSIWLEKTSGPDLQWDRKFHYAEDFYIFTIPKQLLKDSCKYFTKGAYYRDVNNELKDFFRDNTPRGLYFADVNEYDCNFKK